MPENTGNNGTVHYYSFVRLRQNRKPTFPDKQQSRGSCFHSAFEWLPENTGRWQNPVNFQHKDHKFTFKDSNRTFYLNGLLFEIFLLFVVLIGTVLILLPARLLTWQLHKVELRVRCKDGLADEGKKSAEKFCDMS
ncbi:hypothetical protein H2241_04330 [Pantoea ananatis]|uniref:hypothetical protein n=1 Tax=Pantoea ananas TaxID=553 RepID=UPI00158D63DE|nr:hypothetical protein [Pantoea ananatis]MBA4820211.1 hypothetical protein [Pantoea ananatis]QKV90050.1 hypothetical protein FOB88_24395 [Pantoea ananatis]